MSLNPFAIFAVGVQLTFACFAIYCIIKIHRYLKMRRRANDKDAMAWARVVMNPDGPIRPKPEDIERAKRMLRK